MTSHLPQSTDEANLYLLYLGTSSFAISLLVHKYSYCSLANYKVHCVTYGTPWMHETKQFSAVPAA